MSIAASSDESISFLFQGGSNLALCILVPQKYDKHLEYGSVHLSGGSLWENYGVRPMDKNFFLGTFLGNISKIDCCTTTKVPGSALSLSVFQLHHTTMITLLLLGYITEQ